MWICLGFRETDSVSLQSPRSKAQGRLLLHFALPATIKRESAPASCLPVRYRWPHFKRREGDMSKSPNDVKKLVDDSKVEIIDLRFVDLPGVWQHFSLPARAVR